VDIFGIGSTAPAAMLYDALDHFEVRRIAQERISSFAYLRHLTYSTLIYIEKESQGRRKYS
jgi:hypothetical protein